MMTVVTEKVDTVEAVGLKIIRSVRYDYGGQKLHMGM
jgi:hypothetical protein